MKLLIYKIDNIIGFGICHLNHLERYWSFTDVFTFVSTILKYEVEAIIEKYK